MAKIFISYRRGDSAGHAGRLFDHFAEHFGQTQVFMDIDTIKPGLDFIEAVQEAVAACDGLIAVIGTEWLEARDATGTRRLDDPDDLVRLEIATALERGIRVIPVLVQGANAPRATELPNGLKQLATRNALEVTDVRFRYDVERLILALDSSLSELPAGQVDAGHQHGSAELRGGLDTLEANNRLPSSLRKPDPRVLAVAGVITIVLGVIFAGLAAIGVFDRSSASSATAETKVLSAPALGPSDGLLSSEVAPPAGILPLRKGMVRIPSGDYEVGAPKSDDFHIGSKQLSTEGFWIDKYESTNSQYQTFQAELGPSQPSTWLGGTFPTGQENHPVKGLTWDQASAYCVWAGKRLPTEAEWEIAARGPGAAPSLFPWGPDPTASGRVNQMPLVDTYETGSIRFNESSFHAFDMAGNVWEWVGDVYAPVPEGHKILRGGRHGLLRDMAYRQSANPDDNRFVLFAGVRCASDRVAGE